MSASPRSLQRHPAIRVAMPRSSNKFKVGSSVRRITSLMESHLRCTWQTGRRKRVAKMACHESRHKHEHSSARSGHSQRYLWLMNEDEYIVCSRGKVFAQELRLRFPSLTFCFVSTCSSAAHCSQHLYILDCLFRSHVAISVRSFYSFEANAQWIVT